MAAAAADPACAAPAQAGAACDAATAADGGAAPTMSVLAAMCDAREQQPTLAAVSNAAVRRSPAGRMVAGSGAAQMEDPQELLCDC